jgi:hypothetical protein
MQSTTSRRPLVAALALLAIVGCADATAPRAPGTVRGAVANQQGSHVYVATGTLLRRADPLRQDITVWGYITPKLGGSVKIPGTGLKVEFPAKAVRQAMWVSVTARAGDGVVYEFGPHGTQFDTVVKVQQDLRYTNAYHNPELAYDLFGGYTPEGTDDISADGTVRVSEVFSVELQPDNKRTPSVAKIYINHFSGYVLASGRATADVSSLEF